MNKGQLVEAVATKANLSMRDANKAVNAVIDAITETIAGGDKVSITGFGNFEARFRKERTGRNPITGETLNIPAKKVPAFRPGKLLKEAVK